MNVALHGVRLAFGGVTALDGIDLSVAEGEFVALLGPSGSGKTSMLRALAGLEQIDQGHIAVGGRSMAQVPPRERGVGFVFQHYALFRHMTVARNVAFGLEVRPRHLRPTAAEIHERVHTLLDLMGIGELAQRYPSQLSGGQRQRVALARALAIEPKLLLLDEPFGALDAKVRKELRVWLRSLHDRLGLTSIFVTHDQTEALEVADRVAVMRAGRIEQIDRPVRLYDEPATAFVHEFLGEAVKFACTVVDGVAVFDRVPIAPVRTDCPPGAAVALIRPHDIGLVGTAGAARVTSVQEIGPMRRLGLTIADRVLEAMLPGDAWCPPTGGSCDLDLSRARIYPASGGYQGARPTQLPTTPRDFDIDATPAAAPHPLLVK
jgi:sulfate transport system ATP-binding protein